MTTSSPDIDRLPCLAPFAAVAVKSSYYSVCCSSVREIESADVPVDKLFNDPMYTDLRKAMLTGAELPRDCQTCLKNNGTHRAFQTEATRAVAARNLARMDENYAIEQFELAHAVVSFDSTCNLACRTCNPEFSTTLNRTIGAATIRYLGRVPAPLSRTPDAARLELIRRTQACIEVQGGEPFLSKKFRDALETFPKVALRIITNGTVYNARVLEKLAEHPQVLIWVSLDGDAELNDYIRVGASFETIKSNMQKLAEAIPHVQLRVNVTLSKLNVGSIPRILSAIEAMGAHVQGFDYHFVEDSRALRITSISKAQREQIIAGLREMQPQGRHREDAIRMIEHVIRELQTVDTYDDAEDAAFVSFNEAVDTLVAAGLPDTTP